MSYKSDLQAINIELGKILNAVNDLPDAIQRSPLPIEIGTEEEMTAILNAATVNDVGAVYKYTGNTNKYTKGELYIIAEETE